MTDDNIDYEKMAELFRKANPQCNKMDCKIGDFHKSEAIWGNVICVGCMIEGKNFGIPMVMPKDFKIPSDKNQTE